MSCMHYKSITERTVDDLRRQDATTTRQDLLLHLTAAFDNNGRNWVFQTGKQLAEYLGCCVKTIRRAINWLVQYGYRNQ